MKKQLVRLISPFTGNIYIQRLLEFAAKSCQYFIGFGSGSSTSVSGEKILIRKLKQLAINNHQLCVFDVGANKGQFLSLIQNGLQGVSFNVHSFEPGKHTFNGLVETAGKFANVTVNNVGLGKREGELTLFYDSPGSELASLYQRRGDQTSVDFNCSETVKILTLDDYCSARHIQRIDLLKLDVEGHEMDVMLGGARMFKERRVQMVSFEFGGCNVDSRTYFRDFFDYFNSHDMKNIFRITPSGYLSPVKKYNESYEYFRTTNYLACLV